jgi:hypothetical protein
VHSKCDAEVEARLQEAERGGRAGQIAVIVTFHPDVAWEALRRHGLQVRQVFEGLHAVAGEVPTLQVRDLAALDWVLRIEFDGEVRALPADET